MIIIIIIIIPTPNPERKMIATIIAVKDVIKRTIIILIIMGIIPIMENEIGTVRGNEIPKIRTLRKDKVSTIVIKITIGKKMAKRIGTTIQVQRATMKIIIITLEVLVLPPRLKCVHTAEVADLNNVALMDTSRQIWNFGTTTF